MPILGLFAIGRLIVHVISVLWRKEAFRGLFLLTLVTILSGTWVYYRFEPTISTWVDAYYFTVITLTTIGYGDISPTTPFTKIFTTFYVFVGLGIIAGFIGLISEAIIEDSRRRRSNQQDKDTVVDAD